MGHLVVVFVSLAELSISPISAMTIIVYFLKLSYDYGYTSHTYCTELFVHLSIARLTLSAAEAECPLRWESITIVLYSYLYLSCGGPRHQIYV